MNRPCGKHPSNNSNLEKEKYCYCHIAIEDVTKEYCYISEIAGIKEGDYVEIPFGRNNEILPGRITKIELCSANNAPYPPNKTKKIIRVLAPNEPTERPMHRDIRLIKELFESGQVLRAAIRSGEYTFFYETKCPVCGKLRLVDSHVMDWSLHRVSVFAENDGFLRTAAIQKHLDKYGIGLLLEPDLERLFDLLPDTCVCDFENAKMSLFWGGCDGYIKSISDTGRVIIEVNTWHDIEPMSDYYEPMMMDAIERLKEGSVLLSQRKPYENGEYIELTNTDGFPVGCLSQRLSQEILKGLDSEHFVAVDYTVAKTVSRAEQGQGAKEAKLTVTFSLMPTDSKQPLRWLIGDRLEHLCKKSSDLNIYEPGTEVSRVLKPELFGIDDIEIKNSQGYYKLHVYLYGSERGKCHTCANALQPMEQLMLKRCGTIEDGNAIVEISNLKGETVGWLGNHLTSTLATLIDCGQVTVLRTSFDSLSEMEPPFGKVDETYATCDLLLAVNLTGYEELVPIPGDPSKYSGCFVGASEEYRRLVVTIKQNCPNEVLLVSDEGGLYRAKVCEKCGGIKTVEYDFGFDSQSGVFYVWDVIPEPNVVEMLEQDGIMVLFMKYADYCECDYEFE